MTLINESFYLPSSIAELPEGPWLVLAPHPDDEAFGMGGSLLLALAAKIDVDVIFLTDGRAADLNDPELAEKREREAKIACQQLGIRHILFWREIDRELNISPQLINRLSEFITKNQYTTVFFPSPQEPHPDHRVTAVLAWESLRQINFTANPISYEISVQAHTNQLIDITSVIAQKEQIMACYASQMGNNHYIERISALNQSRAWSLPLSVSHAEAFYAWPKENRPLNALLLSLASQQYSLQALPNSLPLVSVIIRTQNRPEFLREAIRSVAGQTYPNIELLVINDGGKECRQLVQEEATGHIQSFQYHPLKNQTGRSHAANIGLEQSNGDLLIFLDDDDWFLPEHIQKLAS
ncbi:MAG: PIG-L family deacetylase, partial [Methyloprofundus sp.]|nr:PIG-L family deacetylase [Methyloprofundus sp.]